MGLKTVEAIPNTDLGIHYGSRRKGYAVRRTHNIETEDLSWWKKKITVTRIDNPRDVQVGETSLWRWGGGLTKRGVLTAAAAITTTKRDFGAHSTDGGPAGLFVPTGVELKMYKSGIFRPRIASVRTELTKIGREPVKRIKGDGTTLSTDVVGIKRRKWYAEAWEDVKQNLRTRADGKLDLRRR